MSRRKKLIPLTDPLWYKDAVIYQLHVKSFYDSNGDGIGDFPGLIERLDYIANLGVNTIWLLPFYPSPRRDDGYDIADYRKVHPDYGSLADFKKFVSKAHEKGIRVITELVVNHTSDQHSWFQKARTAPPGSAARKFYVWSDNAEKYAGTRIIFLDTETSNWTWDPVAGAYFWHRFYSHQPDLNFDNPRVLKEGISVMRFWLDLGVDGLRLDAVPYLVEREGTNNENLPETHEVLRKLRAALDDYAPGRLLLAEANQWPEDAQEYFGAGDECHMSFHFPLMPRMYMAIAQEDRFPITDILRQTPEIPANCQWAIFLRNHDELTLEMVTDGERDYLWETYANDRRARLNLGIRRRLAPLLEHDRSRIELMNGLLMSMPGTPIIYYGDEIGMGDNIHLGDRDGVRTPMQWSPDRNGGFSRANPARLVLPPIMDPLYGFGAVNVEAQASDGHSLLNWTRRMLAVRQRHQAFGRGTFRLLYPANRKVLAFLREHEDETILCVCNLSRISQAVELDLSAFEGRVPVDLIGGSGFPPIGKLTYLLTLPGFAFYWFTLSTDASLPAWHVPAPLPMQEYRTLVLRHGISDIIAPKEIGVLEQEVLPSYLATRRWFASKDQKIRNVRIASAQPMPDSHQQILLSEIEVELAGRKERYFLPLTIVWDETHAELLPQQLAIAKARQGRRVGYVTDAFAADALPNAFLAALAGSTHCPSADGGEIRFLPTSRLGDVVFPADVEIRRLSAEQSNSSMIIGDLAVLKLVRRVSGGIHPETEMTRYLTERGYANTAPLLGELTRYDADQTPYTLAILQGFIRNQGDAWAWTNDFLSRQMNTLALPDSETTTEDVSDAMSGYCNFAAAMGRRLAEFHAVMATPSDDPAFSPEKATAADAAEIRKSVTDQLRQAFRVIASRTKDEDLETDVQALLSLRHDLEDNVTRLAALIRGTLKTRTHGDFHLGQVLVSSGDAYIIDFEGEPARTLEERRAKTSPLRDVAGLLRSFDYVVAASRTADTWLASDMQQVIQDRFAIDATTAFRTAYITTQAEAAVQWVSEESQQGLIDLFLIEKAAYEICYEAANRPAWLGIPLRGLLDLVQKLCTANKETQDA